MRFRLMRFTHAPGFVLAWLLAALGSGPATAATATLRCVTTDGRILYQDTTCPAGSRATPVDATPNSGFRFARQKDIERMAAPPPVETRPIRTRSAPRVRPKPKPKYASDERRFITPGWSTAEVRRKFGPPNDIVRSSATTGTAGRKSTRDSEQKWVYLPVEEDPQTTTELTVRGRTVLHVNRRVTR